MWKRLRLESCTCSFENGKYLGIIMDNSAVKCDEIVESYHEETKLFQQISMERKQPVKRKNSAFYLHCY